MPYRKDESRRLSDSCSRSNARIRFLLSDYGTSSFSDRIASLSRKELDWRKNSKIYKKQFEALGGYSGDVSYDYELLAYAIESVWAGDSTGFSRIVYKYFVDEYIRIKEEQTWL